MKDKEYDFYEEIKDWDFSKFDIETEGLTNWDLYEILGETANKNSIILDLGTGGGEKVLEKFPDVKEVLATDYSVEMINTAKNNLKKSGRKNIEFKVMDNLKMDTKDDYFDIVVARNTVTDPKQIYKTLKKNGILLIHGVDKHDCWSLKLKYGKGQGFKDQKPVSIIDYENVLNAGFKDVELVPIHKREYFKTRAYFISFLLKVPILDDFSEENDNKYYYKTAINEKILDEYIKENTYPKGILLIRRYYGIFARKNR